MQKIRSRHATGPIASAVVPAQPDSVRAAAAPGPAVWSLAGSALTLVSCAHPPGTNRELVSLIGSATAPVVLITASSLLLAALSTKHATIAALLRGLTAEWRLPTTSRKRCGNLHQQIRLFARRAHILWVATVLLHLAIVCFLVTTLEIIASRYFAVLTRLSAMTLPAGIALILAALIMQLREMHLSRDTLACEIEDIRESPE